MAAIAQDSATLPLHAWSEQQSCPGHCASGALAVSLPPAAPCARSSSRPEGSPCFSGLDVEEPMADVFGDVGMDLDCSVGLQTEEVFAEWLQLQNRFRTYDPQQRSLRYRRILVDWMSELGEYFRLNVSTTHVAIMYLDRVLQSVAVARNRLQLVAICCIIIAAKFEEKEEDVPTARDINERAGRPYTSELIYQMEVHVLRALQWNLPEIVPLHFLHYFEARGALYVDDRIDGQPLVDKVPRYLHKYHVFFAELCMQEYGFQQYSSSVTAAAIMWASRRALKIRPLWRRELVTLTGVTLDQLTDCAAALWQYFAVSFPAQAAVDSDHELDRSPTTVHRAPVSEHVASPVSMGSPMPFSPSSATSPAAEDASTSSPASQLVPTSVGETPASGCCASSIDAEWARTAALVTEVDLTTRFATA